MKISMTTMLGAIIISLAVMNFLAPNIFIRQNHLILGISIGAMFFTIADFITFIGKQGVDHWIQKLYRRNVETYLQLTGLWCVFFISLMANTEILNRLGDFSTISSLGLYLFNMGLQETIENIRNRKKE